MRRAPVLLLEPMTDERYTYRNQFVNPGPYEHALTAALMEILGRGIHDLPGIIAALNAKEVRPPGESGWTEAIFTAEMHRLGVGPEPGPLED
jgi:hypothetical protein